MIEDKRRWALVPVIAGLGLVLVVLVASASTTAPQADVLRWRTLSDLTQSAAFPDLDVGSNGLVVVAWTEGPGTPIDKYFGPVKLSWNDQTGAGWQELVVEEQDAVDVALDVTDSTVHLVWIRRGALPEDPPADVWYRTCDLSASPSCSDKTHLGTGGNGSVSEVSRVDVAVDEGGTVHVVWAEGDGRGVYYVNKLAGDEWSPKMLVCESEKAEFPVVTANDFEGLDLLHVAWAEERVTAGEVVYTVVRYGRRDGPDSWACVPVQTPLGGSEDHPARNLSLAADTTGNVYLVWDTLAYNDDGARRRYVVDYVHSGDNGTTWRPVRSYPQGDDTGFGGMWFESGEQDPLPDTLHFLRPHVSLALSGTQEVPVLAWHALVEKSGSGEPGWVQASVERPYKVFWDYATRPGSRAGGTMYWTGEYMTATTDLCGGVDLNAHSATGRVTIVGDLKDVGEGSSDPEDDSYLHTVYHEETGIMWSIIYNNNESVACFGLYLPVLMRNASGGGSEG